MGHITVGLNMPEVTDTLGGVKPYAMYTDHSKSIVIFQSQNKPKNNKRRLRDDCGFGSGGGGVVAVEKFKLKT